MKVRVSTIAYYIFITLTLINLGINHVIGVELDTRYVRIYTASLGILVIVFLTLFKRYRECIPCGKFQFIFACYLLLFVGSEMIYTINHYDQGAFWTYYELCPIIMIVWFYPLLYLLLSKRVSLISLLEMIATFTIISYLLRIIVHLSMMVTGSYFMQGLVFEYGTPGIRNGFYRIQQPCLSSIFIPIAIFLVFSINNKIKKIWYMFGITIAIVFTVTINQSRSILIYQIAIVVSMILFKKRSSKKKIIFWYVIIVIMFVLSQSSVADGIVNFFATFNPNSEYGKSTSIRIETIVYYMGLLKNNIIAGIGALNIGTEGAVSILRGITGTAYLDDIGLLGTVFRYGILGLFLHIMVFGNAIHTIVKFRDTDNNKMNKLFLIHLLLAVLMWGINIDCYFQAVSFGMPIFMAIFEYYKHMNDTEKIYINVHKEDM